MGRIGKCICKNTCYIITTSFDMWHKDKDILNVYLKNIQYLLGLHEWLSMRKFVFISCKTNCMFLL